MFDYQQEQPHNNNRVKSKMGEEQDPLYLETWQSICQNQGSEYQPQSVTIEWTNRILAERDQNKILANINVQQQLHMFMKEVHSLDRSTMKQVMFKFQEAMQFYQWILQKYAQVQPQTNPNQENGNNNEEQQQGETLPKSQVKADLTKPKEQNPQNKKTESEKENEKKAEPSKQEPEQKYLYPSNQENEAHNQFTMDQPQDEPQEPQLTSNYTEYLQIIFEHYCRMSYATGSDPTFEQIQQKTQIMTINKFMIFCKEFGIVKLNGISRQGLVEIFKKNSEFYKEMNFQQFITVLLKIAAIVYASQSEVIKESSSEFQQFLLFLQVNNFSAFKKKIQSLNISYRAKATTQNLVKKPTLENYKFKYTSNNGKTQQQVKEELDQRKRIRSQNKLKLMDKRPKNMSSKKDIIKQQHQLRDLVDRPQVKTTQPTRKQLNPPLPPKKISNNVTKPPAQPVVTGYANIHKLKLLGKQGQADSKMRLNNIVQEAKKMVQLNRDEQFSSYPISNRVSTYGNQTPYSLYNHNRNYTNFEDNSQRGMAQSQHSNYSQRDLHHVLDESPVKKRNYAPHGHSQLQKRQKQKPTNSDLKGIISNDSEEDQYLEEHLNREKKSGLINERIEKKIKEYQLKSFQN